MQKPNFCPQCATELVNEMYHGTQRLQCPADNCHFVFWNNPLPVVAGIVEWDGKVLLVRNVGWPEKWFGLVTGFLEKGETPEQGIVREISEELGLNATLQSFVGVYSFFERNELILAYHLTATGEITIGNEIADYKAIPIDKVKPWPFATGFALGDWLKKRNNP